MPGLPRSRVQCACVTAICHSDLPLCQNESLCETIHIKKIHVKISPAGSFSRTRTNSYSYERFYTRTRFEIGTNEWTECP